jgi:hypothetical protein
MTNPWGFYIWIELVLVTLAVASLIGVLWPNSVFAVEYFRIFARRKLDTQGRKAMALISGAAWVVFVLAFGWWALANPPS